MWSVQTRMFVGTDIWVWVAFTYPRFDGRQELYQKQMIAVYNNNSDHAFCPADAMWTCTSMCACRAKWYRYTWFHYHLLWCSSIHWSNWNCSRVPSERINATYVSACKKYMSPYASSIDCCIVLCVSWSGQCWWWPWMRVVAASHSNFQWYLSWPMLIVVWCFWNPSIKWLTCFINTHGSCHWLQLALVVFTYRNWCKYSTCMCGGITHCNYHWWCFPSRHWYKYCTLGLCGGGLVVGSCSYVEVLGAN